MSAGILWGRAYRFAVALFVATALSVSALAVPALAYDYDMQCVAYTETSGACWETTEAGEHNFYYYWGNWWVQVA